MRKIFLALISASGLLLAARPVVAQTVFAPAGAEWWYETQGLVVYPSFTHARVVGDSTLGGQPARKILLEMLLDTGAGYHVAHSQYEYVRTSGYDVFSWNANTSTYQLEYRFNRPVGSVWSLAGCTPGTSTNLFLDSTSQVAAGSAVLQRQFFSYSSTSGYIAVLERAGAEDGGLFLRPHCGPGPAEASNVLMSYTDAVTRFGSAPVLHRAEPLQTTALRFAPNPSVSGRFRLENLSSNSVSYALFDTQGRRVSAGRLTGADLDLSDQPAGLYLLRGEVAGQAFTRRLVRE